MIPFSVEATLTLALMLQKSWAAMVRGWGFSTNFKSPVKKQKNLLEHVFKNTGNITMMLFIGIGPVTGLRSVVLA